MKLSVRQNLENVEDHGFKVDLSQVKKYSNNDYILLHKDAIKALKKAQASLPKGYYFIILYGYRSLEEQTKIVKQTEKELKQSHPDNWEDLLKKYTGGYEELNLTKFSNNNHRTGKAVDLILGKDNKEIPLGGQTYSPKDKLSYKNLPKNILQNRLILKNSLSPYFNNNPDEYWHWGLKNTQSRAINTLKSNPP
jgi:D-alanyl-D-alanine dipeptidase